MTAVDVDEQVDELDQFFRELFGDDSELQDPDAVHPDFWEDNGTAWRWQADRTWIGWYPTAGNWGSKRVMVEKAGPSMRPHP